MDGNDDGAARDHRPSPTAFVTIAIAEGILIERYQVTAELARALLRSHAAAAQLSIADAAAWLQRTNALP